MKKLLSSIMPPSICVRRKPLTVAAKPQRHGGRVAP